MEERTKTALLYDFFGELLPQKQREYFELYYNDDLSLSEISALTGVSRQGVRDGIAHAVSSLEEYEDKTGIVTVFSGVKSKLRSLHSMTEMLIRALPDGDERKTAEKILDEIDSISL